jgi:hypothetical protein
MRKAPLMPGHVRQMHKVSSSRFAEALAIAERDLVGEAPHQQH